jgi:hypothetical protein
MSFPLTWEPDDHDRLYERAAQAWDEDLESQEDERRIGLEETYLDLMDDVVAEQLDEWRSDQAATARNEFIARYMEEHTTETEDER